MRFSSTAAAALVPAWCALTGVACFSTGPAPYDGPTYDTLPFSAATLPDAGKTSSDASTSATDARVSVPTSSTDAGAADGGGASHPSEAGTLDPGAHDTLDAGPTTDAEARADDGQVSTTPDDVPTLAVSGLTFSVLTKAVGGEYRPKNIGAIWVADAAGRYVKTLAVWAEERREFLVTWCTTTPEHSAWCDYASGSRVDEITSATLSSHRTHAVAWDLTDGTGTRVPAGSYQIRLELTDKNEEGALASVPFDLANAISLAPADTKTFTMMKLATK